MVNDVLCVLHCLVARSPKTIRAFELCSIPMWLLSCVFFHFIAFVFGCGCLFAAVCVRALRPVLQYFCSAISAHFSYSTFLRSFLSLCIKLKLHAHCYPHQQQQQSNNHTNVDTIYHTHYTLIPTQKDHYLILVL